MKWLSLLSYKACVKIIQENYKYLVLFLASILLSFKIISLPFDNEVYLLMNIIPPPFPNAQTKFCQTYFFFYPTKAFSSIRPRERIHIDWKFVNLEFPNSQNFPSSIGFPFSF